MMASASAAALFHFFSSSGSFAMLAAILRASSSVSVLRLKIGELSPRYHVATHLLHGCLLPLAGKPMLTHVIERLRPQVSDLVLNANGDVSRFAAFGLPMVV